MERGERPGLPHPPVLNGILGTDGHSAKAFPADAGVASAGDDKAPQMEVEAAKILLTSGIDFIRGTTQVLQAFTSLLATAYIALLVGLTRNAGFRGVSAFAVAILPLALWVASLAAGYIKAITYRGSDLILNGDGDPVNALETYERVVRDRRSHLLLPSALTLAGIVAFVISLFAVFLPSIR